MQSISYNDKKELVATVNGIQVVIPDSMERKESKDQYNHVCYYVDKTGPHARCFYVAGGN